MGRTRETVQQDRSRLINRLKGLVTTQGLPMGAGASRHHAPVGRDADSGSAERPTAAGVGTTRVLEQALAELDAERVALTTDAHSMMGRYLTGAPGIGP